MSFSSIRSKTIAVAVLGMGVLQVCGLKRMDPMNSDPMHPVDAMSQVSTNQVAVASTESDQLAANMRSLEVRTAEQKSNDTKLEALNLVFRKSSGPSSEPSTDYINQNLALVLSGAHNPRRLHSDQISKGAKKSHYDHFKRNSHYGHSKSAISKSRALGPSSALSRALGPSSALSRALGSSSALSRAIHSDPVLSQGVKTIIPPRRQNARERLV